jgi:3',5'-nucleoside bisphosphate phosphatase
MIDLHTHTSASDGQYHPAEIVEKAATAGISVLAVTDHDTVAGLAEAESAADRVGIRFVSGIELNIEWPTGEFHLLGLSFNRISSSLAGVIASLQQNRQLRNAAIVQKMNDDGIAVTLGEIQDLFPGRSLGRPHFAAFLVNRMIVKSRQAAFDKYLAKGRPWYVDRTGISLDEAVTAIADSGGVPVIAHPLSLYLSWGRMEEALKNIHEQGVVGLEAWHPGARVVDCERLEEMGHRLGYFITAGSDFHGERIRADRKLGYTSGNQKIDDRFWTEELYPYINAIHP